MDIDELFTVSVGICTDYKVWCNLQDSAVERDTQIFRRRRLQLYEVSGYGWFMNGADS